MELQYPEYLQEFVRQPVAFHTVSGRVFRPAEARPETCLQAQTGGSKYNNPVGALIKAGELEGSPVIFVWYVQTQGLLRDFKEDQNIYLGRYWYQHFLLGERPDQFRLPSPNHWVIGHVIRQNKSFSYIAVNNQGNPSLSSNDRSWQDFSDVSNGTSPWINHRRARTMRLAAAKDARGGLGTYNQNSRDCPLQKETIREIKLVFPDFPETSRHWRDCASRMDDFVEFLTKRSKPLSPSAKKKLEDRTAHYKSLIEQSKEDPTSTYQETLRIARTTQDHCYGALSNILYSYNGLLFSASVSQYHDAYHIFDGEKHVCVDSEGRAQIPRYDDGITIALKSVIENSPLKKVKEANMGVFFSPSSVYSRTDSWTYNRERLIYGYGNNRHTIEIFDGRATHILRHEKAFEQLVNMGCKNLALVVLTDPTILGRSVYKSYTALTKVCGFTATQLKILDKHFGASAFGQHSYNSCLFNILDKLETDKDINRKSLDVDTFSKILRLSCVPFWSLQSLLRAIDSGENKLSWFDKVRKVINYLPAVNEGTWNQRLDAGCLDILSDYVRMRNQFQAVDDSLPILPSPSKLQDYHDDLVRRSAELEKRLDAERAMEMNKRYAEVYKKASQLEFKDDKYCIICPKGLEELVYEGRVLSHCVGSYQESVADGKEYILFMRYVTKPDIPWYTIDITPEKVLRQIHTKHNGCICDDVEREQIMDFLRRWCREKGVQEFSLNDINGALCAIR